MGKPSRERSLAENEARAVARNIRISPQKLNLVAEMIRGKKVGDAIADLEFSRKRVAQDVRKCVMSAVANAENNHGLDVDDLVVAEAYVGKNIVMKRFAARGRGRGFSIMKPFSQITVIVREKPEDATDKKSGRKSKSAASSGARKRSPAKAAASKETE
jgi:large subunit ribosomal protein L22